MEIRGKHVLITGANRGIGRALARVIAEDQAHLHVVVRGDDSGIADDLKKHGAASVKIWRGDLSSREATQALLDQLKDQEIDILVNNAGQLTGGLIEDQPLDDIYQMFQVNLLSLIHLTRGLIPGMVARKRGKIVNNASVIAHMPMPCASTYAASKAGVVAFTNCISAELKGTGVSAMTLLTPGVKTRMFNDIDVKYGDHTAVPRQAMSTAEYAKMVREAILLDLPILEPKGATGIGLKIAQYATPLFRWQVQRNFHREKERKN